MTGSDYERKLARLLDDYGYHVIRAPASGAATKRDLPDLGFSKIGEKPIFIELKTTSQNVAYYDEKEVNSLREFAAAFNGHARLCARYKQDVVFYLCEPTNARRTDAGRYAVDRDLELEVIG